jgi:membrane-associated phospholipid phosphatase
MTIARLVLAVLLTCPGATFAQDAPVEAAAVAAQRGGASSFARDVAHDYRHFFSWNNAAWLGVGGAAALAVHPADEPVQQHVLESGTTLPAFGDLYGSQKLQVPVAIAVWAVGHAAGSARGAATGRDLLRAQISVFSWTYAIKYAVGRTRPNGDPHSFPSGHASTSFATAMVLQQHYGWKAGVPAFAAAVYTGASRVADNQHWLSDVVFGAVLGMVSGRTVTLPLRAPRLTVAPLVVAGGGGISFMRGEKR